MQCAVCEGPLPDGSERCGTCGFPLDLAEDAARLMADLPEPIVAPLPRVRGGGTLDRARRSEAGVPATGIGDPQMDLVNRIARDVSQALGLLRSLGGEGDEVSSELAQAALTEADGRIGEVLVLLRDAQARVNARLGEQFGARLSQLEDRQGSLLGTGVVIDLGPELDRIRSEIRAGHREQALQRIDGTDRTLSRMESDWRGLQGLLRQIDQLREAAHVLGFDLQEAGEAVRRVRELLARPAIDVSSLDQGAELAAEALMRLHDAIPSVLSRSLEELAAQIEGWPPEAEDTRRCLQLHAEAVRQLNANRIYDATRRIEELRAAIARASRLPLPTIPALQPSVEAPSVPRPASPPGPLAAPYAGDRVPRPVDPPGRAPPGGTLEPLPTSGAPAVSHRSAVSTADLRATLGGANDRMPEPAQDPDAAGVRNLILRARELAQRVRLLPTESDVARMAAVEIRNATELLRERKMDEAERTLSDLKERLDHVIPETEG